MNVIIGLILTSVGRDVELLIFFEQNQKLLKINSPITLGMLGHGSAALDGIFVINIIFIFCICQFFSCVCACVCGLVG